MNTLRSLGFLVLVATLCGCASSRVWYQPGKSAQTTVQDLASAKADADRLNNLLSGLNLGTLDDSKEKDYLRNTMVAKGYSEVPQSAQPTYPQAN